MSTGWEVKSRFARLRVPNRQRYFMSIESSRSPAESPEMLDYGQVWRLVYEYKTTTACETSTIASIFQARVSFCNVYFVLLIYGTTKHGMLSCLLSMSLFLFFI
ncbi:hypothetical protein J3459_010953 [Metarhizium acridum]|uniref:uncharacterized protein n=1 Tax=Metarhizium acridum TaxID=92637 RepID=UPI001C6C578E|nr:hypothetical protein J3458_019731 [Metarhizium acridum]KAG8420546.1 hypothetical protein J3459_010953 [Metarhizium acridum]